MPGKSLRSPNNIPKNRITRTPACNLRTNYKSRIVRKPDFCLCENKGADQLRGNCEADPQISFAVIAKLISAFVFATRIVQFLYFLNPKFPASSHLVQLGLFQTWSETPKTGFLALWLND